MSGETNLAKFHVAHGRKPYTPTFDDALKALISDDDAGEDRLWAFAVLRSWGNPDDPKDYAVNDDGKKLGISDCGRSLGVRKQMVSEWAQSLSAKNRLHFLEGGIYPVDDPSQPFDAFVRGVRTKKRSKGEDFRLFRQIWLGENPEVAKKRDEARAILATINQQELVAYKAWKASATPRTNEGESEEDFRPPLPPLAVRHSPEPPSETPDDSVRTYKEESREKYVRQSCSDGPKSESEWVSEEDPLTHLKITIGKALRESGFPVEPEDKLLEDFVSLATENAIPAESLCRAIAEKISQKQSKGQKIFSPGALYGFVKQFLPQWIAQHGREIEIDRRFAAGTAPEEQAPQHSREEYEALLTNPSVPEREKQIAREMLGYPEAERKPVDSEAATKNQKVRRG